VSVISGKTNTVTATIPVDVGPFGVGVNPLRNTTYVTNFGDLSVGTSFGNTVSVISGKTNTVTATIPVGAAPGGVATNPLTNTAYVTNFGDNTVSVISG
jgi:YVTN family beta-propeller protein